MDAFAYLSVLFSIILGLAITQILLGYRGLLLARASVTIYLPPLLWSALLLLFAAQSWWASFGLADHDDWTFAGFGVVLLQSALIYMNAAIVLPDFPSDAGTSLREHYYRERRVFHGFLLTTIVVSILKEYVLEGRLPESGNLVFHIAFAAVALSAIVIRRPRFHEILAPVMLLLALAYVGLLFFRLG